MPIEPIAGKLIAPGDVVLPLMQLAGNAVRLAVELRTLPAVPPVNTASLAKPTATVLPEPNRPALFRLEPAPKPEAPSAYRAPKPKRSPGVIASIFSSKPVWIAQPTLS